MVLLGPLIFSVVIFASPFLTAVLSDFLREKEAIEVGGGGWGWVGHGWFLRYLNV